MSAFVLNVASFNGSSARPAQADKNGMMPVIFTSVSKGSLPDKARVISGTVAERGGFHVGKNYLVQVSLTSKSEVYGDQYSYQNLGEISAVELVKVMKDLPVGEVVNALPKETEAKVPVIAGDEEGTF